jgi:short subunit dehydrogenase-like uncharacterized protein
MSEEIRFGVVGGYGATGRAVVSELLQSGGGEILVGGRNLAKGKELAAGLGARVSASQLDVLDAQSLDDFCGGCSIIINCGGPVSQLQDRVAQAAFRKRCNYVEVAGLSFVKERMISHSREIGDLGLRFVVSAGWIPGLCELLAVYADALARTRMDSIESVTVYYGDSGEWSESAYRDIVWYLQQTGLRNPYHFRKGERVRDKMYEASVKVDFGGRVGLQRLTWFSTPELDEIGARLNHCDFFTYSYVPSIRVAFAGALVALLPLSEKLGIRLLQNAYRKVPLREGGFVVVRVLGSSQCRALALTTEIVYDKHRDYWINGLVAAGVARKIADGSGVKTGVHNLADAVDAVAFMAKLRNRGVVQTEKFEPRE